MTVAEATKEYLWVEKYRPKTIEDCILPSSIKKNFSDMLERGEVQNLLLSGGAGCGKTTVARALCEELDSDYIVINCSEDGNIDTLRTKIRNFASTVSISGGNKVVILDEFDYSNAQSTQPALRGFIEEFSDNCRFILTCNYKNRLIPPLHSRCSVIDFFIPNSEKPKLAKEFMSRVVTILNDQNIKHDKRVVAEVINKYFPDWRRVLNELQRYSVSGTIDAGILVDIAEVNIKELMHSMKNKEFTNVRKWVVNNLDNDSVRLFRRIYDSLYDYVDNSSIPHVVVILGDYQYKSAFVADQEINLMACFTEIMARAKFK